MGDEARRRRGRGHVARAWLTRDELAPDSTCCAMLVPGRNGGAGQTHDDPRSGQPARFGPGQAGTASRGHTNLGQDDPEVVPERDSSYARPEQI